MSNAERVDFKTPEGIAHLKKRVQKAVSYKFRNENTEDIFQEVYLRFLERPDSKQSIEYCIIDILRERDGRLNHGTDSRGKAKLHQASDVDDQPDVKDMGNPYDRVEARIDIGWRLDLLDKRDRDIIERFFFKHQTGDEIAKKHNLSAAMIGIRKHTALDIMRHGRKPMEQQEQAPPPEDLISVQKFCKINHIDYVRASNACKHGIVPFELRRVRGNYMVRHLTPEIRTILCELRQLHGHSDMFNHLPWKSTIVSEIVASKGIEAPDTIMKVPNDIKAKILKRARELRISKSFEASCELYALAVDL